MSDEIIKTHQDLLEKMQDKGATLVINGVTKARMMTPPPIEGSGLKPAGDYNDQETFIADKSIVIDMLQKELGVAANIPGMRSHFKETVSVDNGNESKHTYEAEPGVIT